MKEIVQLTDWKFKFRRSNKKGTYELIKRRDGTYYCSCPSHKYNGEVCKHIKLLKAFLGEYDEGITPNKEVLLETSGLYL